jgi:hypothetical protein
MKPNKSSHKQYKSLIVLREVFLSVVYTSDIFFLLKLNHRFIFREGCTMLVCFSFCIGEVIIEPISPFGSFYYALNAFHISRHGNREK